MGNFRVGTIAHFRRVHQCRNGAHLRQKRVKPGREALRHLAHQQCLRQRAGNILVSAGLIMSRIARVGEIKPLSRRQNCLLKRLIAHCATIIQRQREGKRGVVVRPDADRIGELTEVIHQPVANVLG